MRSARRTIAILILMTAFAVIALRFQARVISASIAPYSPDAVSAGRQR